MGAEKIIFFAGIVGVIIISLIIIIILAVIIIEKNIINWKTRY